MGFLQRSHPAVRAVYLVAVPVIAMFCVHPVTAILTLLGGIAAVPVSGAHLTRRDGFIALIAVLIALTNPLFAPLGQTVLFRCGPIVYSLEALFYGAVLGVTVAAVLLWGRVLTAAMPADGWMTLLGGRLPHLALVLTMTLRFIPLLGRIGRQMLDVRRVQNGDETRLPLKRRVAAAGKILVSLMSRALEQALDTAVSMQARGYALRDANGKPVRRTNAAAKAFGAADAARLTVCILLITPIIAAAAAGGASLTYYPTVVLPAPDALSVAATAALAALVFWPAVSTCKEVLSWRRSRSRI